MQVTFRPMVWTGVRTPAELRRSRHTFKAPWSNTLMLLERELEQLSAYNVVLQADFREWDITLSGMPRANARQPNDPGVILNFETPKLGELSYPCDSCAFWQHNVRSIALGLQALRKVDLYGITQQRQQYTGFKAIGGGTPLGSSSTSSYVFADAEAALAWLGRVVPNPQGVTRSARSMYHEAVKRFHPDSNPGETENWDKLDAARQVLHKGGLL